MDLCISIAAIIILMILSAFFSGSETAFTAASKARLHSWEKEGNKRAAQVNKVRERKDKLIGALLLGNNFVNITSSAIATGVLIKLFGDAGVAMATFIMTALLLVFSEVLPKTYAIHYADKVSIALVPLVKCVILIFSPLAQAVNWIVWAILKLFGADISKASTDSHIDMLRGAIELHDGVEKEVQTQRSMLRSILELQDVGVGEIMTHRKNVLMVNAGDPIEKIIDDVLASPNTRLPLYRDDPDNIIGVVHTKALLRELRARGASSTNIDIQALAHDPWFIPDTTTLADQLQAFRLRREHFAIVIDEYGSFKGIVTLEDILEEIVGDIDDEHDIQVQGVRRQPNGSYMIDGTVTIRDLNRELNWDLPDEDYATIAGLVVHEAKMIPEPGQSFTFYDFRFDVVRRLRNQLTLIRVMPSEPAKTKSS